MANATQHRDTRASLGRLVGASIVLLGISVAFYVSRLGYHQPRTDDATVRANLVGIAPHVGGPIVDLRVVDNQAVKQDDVLFVIDPRPFEVVLARTRADLLLAQSEVDALGSAVGSASADVRRLEAESAFATDHAKRLQGLLADQFVTRDRLEQAQSQSRATSASLDRARREESRQESLLAQFGEVNARLEAARAAVAAAELDVEYCTVRAPFDARVTNLNLSVGGYAQAGQEVFALVDTRQWYVLANFQETYLASIRPGMRADVLLLSYPRETFHGTVQGIGWAIHPSDGATVGVLPEVKQTLNWVRLAQRIPVRIALEPPRDDRPYRMGMTAVVTIRPAAK